MKTLRNIAWALALALLLVSAGKTQDKDGVKGYEVFSTPTPGGGGTLESQGLTGQRTPFALTHSAPALPGVVNVVVTYYDSQESLDKAKEREKKAKDKKEKEKKGRDDRKDDPPPVPTYDPRFYEYKDGKLIPKAQQSSGLGAATDNRAPTSAQGLVFPDNVYDGQAFSFAVPQAAGEVLSIQSANGVVVQQSTADQYGRVFLATGLPFGVYLISGESNSKPVGQIEIKQHAADTLQYTSHPFLMRVDDIFSIANRGAVPNQPAQTRGLPPVVKLSEPFALTGHGFSSNCADMQVSLTGSGKTQAPLVLAATEDQLKLAPVQQLPPGPAQLTVTNKATGQSAEARAVLLYDMQGHLERRKLTSGSETQLVVNTQPETAPLKVKATVDSGPVDFGAGRKEAEAITSNGRAIFPVHADERGSGLFQLTWEVAPVAYNNQSPTAPQTAPQRTPSGTVDTNWLDRTPGALTTLSDYDLITLRQDLNRRKDHDYAAHGGAPGPDSPYLWHWIQQIEAELRSRLFTIDSAGNAHTPPNYRGTSGLEPGHSYPPR